MHMILIHSNLEKLNLVTIGDFLTHIIRDLVNLFIDDCSSIFCWIDKMMDQDGYIMTFSDQVTHMAILSRSRAAGYSTRLGID